MRRRAVRSVGLVLATLGFSHPAAAQLRDGSDGTLPPRNPEPCSNLIPPLAFTKEDFEKGFDRTYTIPEYTECDGAAIGGDPEFYIHQSGQLRLHYVPSQIPRMYAEVRYQLREGCGADKPEGDFSWVWSGVLDPTDHDPEGIFPAAAYEDILAKPKIVSDKACGGGGSPSTPHGLMGIKVGLVYTDHESGEVIRQPFFESIGFSSGTFGSVRGKPEETSVTIEPGDSYETWRPRGNLDPSRPGNQLTVHVKVHEKDDPDVPRRASLRFAFREVSRERGVCLNWPADGADIKPDLKLRFADESLGTPSADGTSIETSGLVEELDLIVESYDFGAWGTLRISGTDKDKKPVNVKVMGKGTPDLTIPLDDDGNRIADAWEPKAARGKAADADDEHQEGNSHDGDGLTLYEEYRGFVENGKRQQGNPAKKDFFVLDLVNSDTSRMGIALLEEAAQLEVHSQFTPEEFGLDRVINKNSSSGLKQHGVVLDTYDRRELDKGFSQAIGGPGPPRTVSKILISDRNISSPAKVPGEAYTDAAAEIAHELLHACSVWHHGEGDIENVSWTKKARYEALEESSKGNARVQVLLEDGKAYEFPLANTIRVWLATEHGQHSGDDTCLMRYHKEVAAYSASARFGSGDLPVRYKADGGPIGLRLCRSANGTGVNAYDHKVKTASGLQMDLPRWGDAAPGRGNCFGQINVSDRAASGP